MLNPVVLLMIASLFGHSWPEPRLEGRWEGVLRQASWCSARLELRQTGHALRGRLDVPELDADVPVSGSVAGQHVHLEAQLPSGRLSLDGTLDGASLRSRSSRLRPGAFHLVRATSVVMPVSDYLGWYEWKPGDAFLVDAGSGPSLRVMFLGRLFGTLLPVARDRYRLVQLDAAPLALSTEVRFVRDASGRVCEMVMASSKLLDGERAPRLASYRYTSDEIAFRNGDIALHGRFIGIADGKPHPAVVFVHGTGFQTIDHPYELTLTAALLQRGVAVMTYDKRGCGHSTGDWHHATLDELAGDAAAAVAALRSRADVLAHGIGVYGVSEGGWIAPAVAARSRDVAFVVDQGGPAVPPLEDERDDLTAGIAALGLDDADRDAALEVASALLDLYRTDDALPRYRRSVDAARNRPWFDKVRANLPESVDDLRVQWWRKRGQFRPAPYWKELRVPALVLIGEKDATMDVPKNARVFEEYRRENPAIELRLVPNAGHALTNAAGFAPGFPGNVADWIRARVGG